MRDASSRRRCSREAGRRKPTGDLREPLPAEQGAAPPETIGQGFPCLLGKHLGALRDVAQDWVRWVEEGWLDAICPMDYTPDVECLRRAVQQQVALAGGRVPVYAGLGAFILPSPRELATQIQVARESGATGFCTFSYDMKGFDEWLPELVKLL